MTEMLLDKIKGKLGFGCMRLPLIDGEVDKARFCEMVDSFLDAGFNYFDTAYGYIDGKSETAIRECITKRHKREDFVLADKLSYWLFEKEEDVIPLFEKQLEKCGVEYFDFYLFHCMNEEGYAKHKECNTFEIIKKLKEQGKIKHIGMSFHDTAEVLDTILTENPFVEFVQLQFNYLDYDDPSVQSKACYDVAVKHGKKIWVMEPVKGGALVNLHPKAKKAIERYGDSSEAACAIRFVLSFPEIAVVLSGMGDMNMINDNVNTVKNAVPFNAEEIDSFTKIRSIIREVKQIPCTKCNYCADVCPSKVKISEVFAIDNKYLAAKISRSEAYKTLRPYYENLCGCIECGKCESTCPQNIEIRKILKKIKKIAEDLYLYS